MTKKKYILIFITFFLLLALCLFLFTFGLYFKENNLNLFILFMICAIIVFIASIIFIVINYKKLIIYEKNKLSEKMKHIDFIYFDSSISDKDCIDKLLFNGYKKIKDDFFHKEVEVDCGDGGFYSNYYSKIVHVDGIVDTSDLLVGFTKGLITYNFAYFFIEENIEQNLEMLKKYIKETVIDVKVHRYGYKCFFVPIIFTNNKIYYIEAGSFISEYKTSVTEALRVLGINEANCRRG